MKKNMSSIRMDLNPHYHLNWFEVEKIDLGVIIMCPEGCRRLLNKNGKVKVFGKQGKFLGEYDEKDF